MRSAHAALGSALCFCLQVRMVNAESVLKIRGGHAFSLRRRSALAVIFLPFSSASLQSVSADVAEDNGPWTVPAGLAKLAASLEAAQPLVEDRNYAELRELLRTPIFGSFLGFRPLDRALPSATPSADVLEAYPAVARAEATVAFGQLARRLGELDALCERASRARTAVSQTDADDALTAARYHLTEAISRYYGPTRQDGTIECLACAGDWGDGNMR